VSKLESAAKKWATISLPRQPYGRFCSFQGLYCLWSSEKCMYAPLYPWSEACLIVTAAKLHYWAPPQPQNDRKNPFSMTEKPFFLISTAWSTLHYLATSSGQAPMHEKVAFNCSGRKKKQRSQMSEHGHKRPKRYFSAAVRPFSLIWAGTIAS